MDDLANNAFRDSLVKRRDRVVLTLNYIGAQLRVAQENTEWRDEIACQNRKRLLEDLTDWYLEELDEIDMALGSILDDKR